MKTLSDWGRERTVALIIIGFLAIVFVLAIVEGENEQREKVEMQRVWELEQLNLKKADPVAWAAEQERLEKYRQRRAAARLKKKMREAAEERELTLCAMRKSVGSPFVPLTVLKGKCLLDWAGEALSQEWRRASDQRGNTYQRELNR